MNRQKFIDRNLETLLQDRDIQEHMRNAQTPEQKIKARQELERSVGEAYDNTVKGYFEKGVGSYIANAGSLLARGVGLATGLLGTYTFWLAGAGFGLKVASMAPNTLADAIDHARFEATVKAPEGGKMGARGKVAAETLVERAATYLPGGEIADFIGGVTKYDRRATNVALYTAKQNFLGREIKYDSPIIEKDGAKIVPLKYFKDHRYARAA